MNILTDLLPVSLATAVKANLYALFDSFGRSAQAEFHRGPGLIRWRTAIAHAWFNGVLVSAPAPGDPAQAIGDALAHFQSNGVRGFSWWFAPGLQPDGWEGPLRQNGFQLDNQTPGLAIDLSLLPPADGPLVIRPVENAATLHLWSRTFAAGYGLPDPMTQAIHELLESLGLDLPSRHYLGYLDGQAVAASTLFLGAGVAGVYNVATLAGARRRGFGSAMTLRPLLDARELGYRGGILQSSDMGLPVYQRLGFQVLCQMDHYIWRISPANG